VRAWNLGVVTAETPTRALLPAVFRPFPMNLHLARILEHMCCIARASLPKDINLAKLPNCQKKRPPPTLTHSYRSHTMAPKAVGLATALVLATLLVMGGTVEAQGTRQQRVPRPPRGPPGPPGQPGANPQILVRCFVPSCSKCNNFNPYLCAECGAGYQLTASFACNSCAPNYEQNLEERSFVCQACPQGTTSPGGTGGGSQCVPITATTAARRLFGADEDDLWA
jgi:hypothetical protein